MKKKHNYYKFKVLIVLLVILFINSCSTTKQIVITNDITKQQNVNISVMYKYNLMQFHDNKR
jgi:hypothetical protein